MGSKQDQQKYTGKLANSNILVVGGTSGLGFGLAEALLEQSPPPSNIILSSSNPQRVEKAIQRLKNGYPNASSKTKLTGLTCDLSDEDNLESNIKKLFESLPVSQGELNHVVQTAGDSLATMPISEITLPKMKQAGMVRFFSPLLIAKYAATYLAPGPASSITITGGGVADHPIPNWSIISSYASGLHGMILGLALDLKPIRVNLIQPGGVNTEMWDSMGEKKEQMMAAMGKNSATGKIGAVEDVVEGYLCFMKDANITGKIIGSDSGHGLV